MQKNKSNQKNKSQEEVEQDLRRDIHNLMKQSENLGYLKSLNRIGSIRITMGWLIGYFVVFYPLRMWMPHGLIYSLLHSSFGVLIAIIFLWIGRRR